MMAIIKCLGWIVLCLLLVISAAYAGEVIFFYHTDPAGTPFAITDVNRNVVWRADFLPFGEENVSTGTIDNDFRFVGKEQDRETGLYYFGARYMESAIGRFISPDPVGPVDPKTGRINEKYLLNPQRLNSYTYALNSPYRYLDLAGKWAEDVHSGIGFKHGTYTWAREVGFSERDAEIIARGDNSTDGGFKGWVPGSGDQSRHFDQTNTFQKGKDSRDYWAEVELKRAVESYKKGDYDKALGELGRGLHSKQDREAHGAWDTGLIGMRPHPNWFDDWHDPRNKESAAATERSSKEYLKKFIELTR
jgi:RHS repeat-associated protein